MAEIEETQLVIIKDAEKVQNLIDDCVIEGPAFLFDDNGGEPDGDLWITEDLSEDAVNYLVSEGLALRAKGYKVAHYSEPGDYENWCGYSSRNYVLCLEKDTAAEILINETINEFTRDMQKEESVEIQHPYVVIEDNGGGLLLVVFDVDDPDKPVAVFRNYEHFPDHLLDDLDELDSGTDINGWEGHEPSPEKIWKEIQDSEFGYEVIAVGQAKDRNYLADRMGAAGHIAFYPALHGHLEVTYFEDDPRETSDLPSELVQEDVVYNNDESMTITYRTSRPVDRNDVRRIEKYLDNHDQVIRYRWSE